MVHLHLVHQEETIIIRWISHFLMASTIARTDSLYKVTVHHHHILLVPSPKQLITASQPSNADISDSTFRTSVFFTYNKNKKGTIKVLIGL